MKKLLSIITLLAVTLILPLSTKGATVIELQTVNETTAVVDFKGLSAKYKKVEITTDEATSIDTYKVFNANGTLSIYKADVTKDFPPTSVQNIIDDAQKIGYSKPKIFFFMVKWW